MTTDLLLLELAARGSVAVTLWRLCPTRAFVRASVERDVSAQEYADRFPELHMVCEVRRKRHGYFVELRCADRVKRSGPWRDLSKLLACAQRARGQWLLTGAWIDVED